MGGGRFLALRPRLTPGLAGPVQALGPEGVPAHAEVIRVAGNTEGRAIGNVLPSHAALEPRNLDLLPRSALRWLG